MENSKSLVNVVVVSLMVVSSFVCNPNQVQPDAILGNSTPSMRGVCWVAGDSIAEHNIQQIADVGVNWISQTPFGWMEGIDSPVVHGNFDRAWWGENDRGIIYTTELSRTSGIKTMLKPHIWLHAADGKWRSDIAMNSEEEWEQWFSSYESWILHYAEVAQKGSMESFCIGTELHQTIKRTEQWRDLIYKIREVYDGHLTYAANWYQEYQDVKFWDDLDYIGIQGYFPLSDKSYPSKKDLKKGWEKHIADIEKISLKYDKKIVFTEIGYKNTADTAHEPWVWPSAVDSTVVRSDKTQRIAYEALFESFWDKPWFDGFFIWKWFHSTHKYESFDDYHADSDRRRDEYYKSRNRAARRPIYFSPQRTEAMDVLSEWYLDH